MNKEGILGELQFKAVRSSGAGGQHVNKTSSKVIVTFNLLESDFISNEEKEILKNNLSAKLSKNGEIQVSSSESRSQHTNKEKAVKRLLKILEKGAIVPKKRKPTKISKTQKLKRLSSKRKQADKKSLRKKPDL